MQPTLQHFPIISKVGIIVLQQSKQSRSWTTSPATTPLTHSLAIQVYEYNNHSLGPKVYRHWALKSTNTTRPVLPALGVDELFLGHLEYVW